MPAAILCTPPPLSPRPLLSAPCALCAFSFVRNVTCVPKDLRVPSRAPLALSLFCFRRKTEKEREREREREYIRLCNGFFSRREEREKSERLIRSKRRDLIVESFGGELESRRERWKEKERKTPMTRCLKNYVCRLRARARWPIFGCFASSIRS